MAILHQRIFQAKPGQAAPLVEHFKSAIAQMSNYGIAWETGIYTDYYSGRSDRVMVEWVLENVGDIDADLEMVYTYFPRLKERRRSQAGYTSGGEQQMLAIGRALMSRPRLLLLDEPSLGLAPLVVKQIFSIIREINETEKITIFLVEQNAFHALKLAHRGYVMATGQIVTSGTGQALLADPEVRRAYLEGGH